MNSVRKINPLSAHIGMAMSCQSFAHEQESHIISDASNDLQKMLLGIKSYESHSFKNDKNALQEIWRQGEVSVEAIPGYDYKDHKKSVLLVPSLINKSDILDLMPERSLLAWLAAQNINPYLLDWGDPVKDERQGNIDELILERLVPAINFVQQKAQRKTHLLGYCMGGTLLVAAAKHMVFQPASLIFLAAPWDFHGGTQILLNRVRFWAPGALPAVREKGKMDVSWMQTLFASLDPSATVKKFCRFSDMDQDSEEARIFVAVEDWLNDGADLPSGLAEHFIRQWFLENRPGRGEWQVGGKAVKPADIDCPALVVASSKDKLVEFETASILGQEIKGAELLNPSCGHIGMIAGRRAVEDVWTPIARWIHQTP